MSALRDLAARWRDEADALERYGDDRAATACRLHAAELEAALSEAADELLTPSEAAEYSGMTERTLRSWKAEGRLRNHGSDARPLYRRGDLPHRPESEADGFDARAAAMRMAS